MISLSDKFIDYLYQLTQGPFSQPTIEKSKMCLLDYLGVTFAGASILKNRGNVLLDSLSKAPGMIPVIGFNRKSDLFGATLVNGMCAHIAELDDGVRQGSVHPGAPIISALIPLAIQYQASGNDLLKGIIVGYEAAIRLAQAIQPSHRNKGYHATGTCGTIGTAIGIGAMLGFTRDELHSVLSAASTSAAGMLNVTKGSSELKPYNAGQAAVSGMSAALVARSGFTSLEDVLNGKWGFLEMVADKCDLSVFDDVSCQAQSINKAYIKTYAACRHCHPAIEATLCLRNKFPFELKQIEKISVGTYHLAVNGHDHINIQGIPDSKMSIPFSVAVALLTGKAGIQEYTSSTIGDACVQSIAKKVNVYLDETLDSFVPEKRPAIVTISTVDKKTFSHRIDLAKGEPENPLSSEEIVEKFLSLCSFAGKTTIETKRIITQVLSIDSEDTTFLKQL